MKEISDLINKIKSGQIKVSVLSRETGINADKIYKWVQRGVDDIKATDEKKLKQWADKDKSPKSDKVPQEAKEPGAEMLAKSILNLTETNKSLAEQSGVNSKTLSALVDRLLSLGTDDFRAFLLGDVDKKAPSEYLRDKKDKSLKKGS